MLKQFLIVIQYLAPTLNNSRVQRQDSSIVRNDLPLPLSPCHKKCKIFLMQYMTDITADCCKMV